MVKCAIAPATVDVGELDRRRPDTGERVVGAGKAQMQTAVLAFGADIGVELAHM
jgi:hypothetical protein